MSKENEESALKLAFAEYLLKTPNDSFKAGLCVFPENTARALRVANEWPFDSEVLKFQSELLKEEGESSFLPTKADLARNIWDKMQGPVDSDDYAKLGKLYADVRGFIEKPQTNINNNVSNVVNRVMVVKESVSDSEWESKLKKQQEELTNAVTKH